MRKQKGFSLIELLIVVGIIGALTAIAVPAYQSYTLKSEATAGVATVKSILTNIDVLNQEVDFPADTTDNWTKIGAAKDMSNLGAMTLAQTTETTGTGADEKTTVKGGTITFAFNSDAALTGKKIRFTKSANGWACIHDTGVEKLKSCVAGTVN
ncbi:type II secretion system protein [Enterovibrio makurazakiensis]|uniref:pilin n=1 Tax=Enterovibrio makurazakiensis TaxID=2910232 RepID=UPI003D1CDA1D